MNKYFADSSGCDSRTWTTLSARQRKEACEFGKQRYGKNFVDPPLLLEQSGQSQFSVAGAERMRRDHESKYEGKALVVPLNADC